MIYADQLKTLFRITSYYPNSLANQCGTVILLSFFLCASSVVHAVTVSEVTNSPIGCTTLVRGVFNPGSSDLIRRALLSRGAYEVSEGVASSEISYQGRLCFDSPGGSFLEGVAIARMLRARTGVDAEHVCESACFLAFMTGVHDRQEDRPIIPDRVMHPTATVGYHAPGLLLSADASYTAAQVDMAWTTALLSIAEIVRLRHQNSTFFFRDELIDNMLRVPTSQMRHIITVRDAIFYNIVVYPIELPELNTSNLSPFTNVCRALGLLSTDFDIVDGPEYTNLQLADDRPWIFFTGAFDRGESDTDCLLTYYRQSSNEYWSVWDLGIMRADRWSFPPNDFSIAAFMHYPQSMRIRDLPRSPDHVRINRLRFERLLAAVNERDTSVSCGLTSASVRVTNVNEYVNLRRQPDLSATIIRQIPLGWPVRLVRNGITVMGPERDRQSCINACRAFAANRQDRTARERAQQCIQDNMIWYEITDAVGDRGWVSRRYLEETQ
jgi:hypothetical protein